MRIKLYIAFLATVAITVANGQNKYSVETIEQLDIKGFNLKLNPDGNKFLYTTSNYNGLWLYNIGDENAVEISSKNGAGYEPLITDEYIFYKSKESQNTLQRMGILSKNRISINLSAKDQTPKAFYACEGASKVLEAKASADLYSIVLVYKDGSKNEIAPLGKKNYLNISLSPDESKILFRVSGLGSYVTHLDGTVVREFKTAEFPVWLNENEILFAEVKDDGHQYVSSDLFVSSINGNEKFNLTSSVDAIAIYPNVNAKENKVVFNTPEGDTYLISLVKE